jgi:RimJ/RimL family protein N-acetyltransferase
MAKIQAETFLLKNAQKVLLCSPSAGDGASLVASVREIMERSEHLLTTAAEFAYTAEQEEELIANHAADPCKLLITPKMNGKILGILNFSPGNRLRNRHQGELGISLLPEAQGQGLGSRMFELLLEWAKGNPELECLRLRVHARNLGALALYRKFQFVEEGREILGVKLGPGKYDDVISMARFL